MSERNSILGNILGEGLPRIIINKAKPAGWILSNTADDGTSLTAITVNKHYLNIGQLISFPTDSDDGELTGTGIAVLSTPTEYSFTIHIASAAADTGGYFEAETELYKSSTSTTYTDTSIVIDELIAFEGLEVGMRVNSFAVNNGISEPTYGKLKGVFPGSDEKKIKSITALLGSTGRLNKAMIFGSYLWVTVTGENKVLKINKTTGTTEYVYSGSFNFPFAITNDGTNVWVTNFGTNSVTKITVATHALNEYTGTGNNPCGIVLVGTNLWTCNSGSNSVSKITLAGSITNYTDATLDNPQDIASDGTNLWTCNYDNSSVSKILASNGTITTYTGLGSPPNAILWDGTYLRVALVNGFLARVATDGTISATAVSLAYNQTAIMWDESHLWSVGGSEYGLIHKANLSTGAIETFTIGSGSFTSIVKDGTSLWIVNQTPTGRFGWSSYISEMIKFGTQSTLEVDSWSNGTPTDAQIFKIDGWIIDLPRTQEMTEDFDADVLVHGLYGGDAGQKKETKHRGYAYACRLDYSKFFSGDALFEIRKLMSLGSRDSLILIPRRDKPQYQYNVYIDDSFSISKYGKSPGYRKPVFVFLGKENIADMRMDLLYGSHYGTSYGKYL
jgi:streptogramin lyase